MTEVSLPLPRASAPSALLRMLPDAQLAERAANGSAGAFAAIYQRHHQDVYRYCRSIAGNDEDARDALQNTMLKAMRALEGESRKIALKPWLFRIAHNETISIVRRRSPDAPLDTAHEVAALGGDPESRQRLRELIGDLDRLAPKQRAALVMRELSGLGFDEIGVALETSPTAAKQAVYEARLALHDFEAGREMSCDEIRRKISADDRRLLRARIVRAHLGVCEDCRGFQHATRARRGQLAAIAPPLPAPAAAAILSQVIGGGGGGLTTAGGGAAIGLGSATAVKLGVAGVIALGVGGVALRERDAPSPGAGSESLAPAAAELGGDSAASGGGAGSQGDATSQRDGGSPAGGADPNSSPGERGASADASGGDRSSANAATADATGQAQAGGQSAAAEGSTPAAAGEGSAGGGASAGGEHASEVPGNGSGAGSSNGNGPAGTPPGHGGTPPGQGGTPPGLGEPPPGHGGTPPGQSGSAPGQSGSAPGQSLTPPGQGGTPPGQSGGSPGSSGSAPGNSGASPGNSGSAPGNSGSAPGTSGSAPGNSGASPGNSGDAPGHGGG